MFRARSPCRNISSKFTSSVGAALKTLATYSNLDQTTAYVQKTFDVSAYEGQTVQVYFKMVEDNGKATSFRLDDITLTTQ